MQSQDFTIYAPQPGKVLVLKSLKADLKAAYNNFQWPDSGHIAAPDWMPVAKCGDGLHGWLWGEGDADLRVKDEDAKWLVLSVDAESVVELDGKVKFPECEVVYCGDRETAVAIIAAHAPAGSKIIFATVTGGNRATVTGGENAVLICRVLGKLHILEIDGVKFLPKTPYKVVRGEWVEAS